MYAIRSTHKLKLSILHKLASGSPLVSDPRRSSRLIHAAITAEAGPLLRLPAAACALHVARRRASPSCKAFIGTRMRNGPSSLSASAAVAACRWLGLLRVGLIPGRRDEPGAQMSTGLTCGCS